jgi:dTDP-4-dehydrorhamnose 3,5-epimerase-like enzyme
MRIKVKNSGVVKLTARKHPKLGHLFVAESKRHIPFPIKRTYVISNVRDKSAIRGNHAHKKTAQVMFCVSGSFNLHLDDGELKQKLLLDNPECGVILGPMLWHAMSEFSKDCVILVFASHYYDEGDYIRDYEDFLEAI